MLASVYSYRVMVKSVSSCCVHGRRVLSNPVTYDNISAVNKTARDSISKLKAQQIHLHCFSGYPQYQKELINKAERSLTDHSSPVIVKISGISRMMNDNNSIHWANNSFNLKGEIIGFTVLKYNSNPDYMKVIYTRPLTIKTSELTLMNQLNDRTTILWVVVHIMVLHLPLRYLLLGLSNIFALRNY